MSEAAIIAAIRQANMRIIMTIAAIAADTVPTDCINVITAGNAGAMTGVICVHAGAARSGLRKPR